MILGLSVILFFAALLWMWVAGYRFGPQRRAIHVITSPVVWLVSAFFSGDWRSPAQPRGPILKSVKIDGKPMKMSTGERVLNYQVDWIGVWNKRTEINLIILDESTVLNSTTSAPPADFYLTDETGRRYDEPQLTAWGEDSWSGQIDGHSAYHQRISFAPLQVLSSHFQIHFNYANRVLAFDVLWPEGSSLPDQK